MENPELTLFVDKHVFDDMTDKQVQIFAAAVDVFAEKGYANTSTKEIAQRANVSEGNIFSKFTSKRGLLNAIIDPVVQNIFPTFIEKAVHETLPKEYLTLHAYIQATISERITFLKQNAKVLKIFISELIYSDKTRSQLLQNYSDSLWQNINQGLHQMKKNHLIINISNQEILRIIWSILGGLVISYLFFNQDITKTQINHSVDALVKGLAPKEK